MVIFPFTAMVVSLGCMALVGIDAIRRPRPDLVVWTVAFTLFAIAAACEVIGSVSGWTPAIVRTYYLFGAVLVVGFLALGEGYLLAAKRIARFAPGLTLLVTAVAATLVLDAPIDQAKLASHGWEALERGPALVALTVSINSIGSIVLVGGALWSAWKFNQRGIQRQRMIGCVCIALGTLVVASGGTLTRFGQREYLYIAMSIGVAIIFAGVVQSRRSDQVVTERGGFRSLLGKRREYQEVPQLVRIPSGMNRTANEAQAIDYLTRRLLPLSDEALEAECRVWSVERRSIKEFDRSSARKVWAVRTRLESPQQAQYDALSPAARLQIAELYFEVFLDAELVERAG